MSNERFSEIARNVFRAGNIQVLSHEEYKEFIKECRMFKKMPVFDIIKWDTYHIAFKEFIR